VDQEGKKHEKTGTENLNKKYPDRDHNLQCFDPWILFTGLAKVG
jgi:hypothetical protein